MDDNTLKAIFIIMAASAASVLFYSMALAHTNQVQYADPLPTIANVSNARVYASTEQNMTAYWQNQV